MLALCILLGLITLLSIFSNYEIKTINRKIDAYLEALPASIQSEDEHELARAQYNTEMKRLDE